MVELEIVVLLKIEIWLTWMLYLQQQEPKRIYSYTCRIASIILYTQLIYVTCLKFIHIIISALILVIHILFQLCALELHLCGGLGKGVIWDCAFFSRKSRLKFKYCCCVSIDTNFAKRDFNRICCPHYSWRAPYRPVVAGVKGHLGPPWPLCACVEYM